MMKSAAIYARVSSDRQVQQATIGSQVAALRERAERDGVRILEPDLFIDDGATGTTLVRPALERLRDRVAFGSFDRIYVHSPDRLARRYAYQVLLLEEFRERGVETIFIHGRQGTSPEDELLLQVQGVIAEYERARLLERCRRGRLFKARAGQVSVLTAAPYGYRYVPRAGGEPARFDVVAVEAAIVRDIFGWLVQDQLSLAAIARRLDAEGVPTRRGRRRWMPSTIQGILENTCYVGEARFGKTEVVAPQPRVRPNRGHLGPPQRALSARRDRPIEDQIVIPVPPLVPRAHFDAAAAQLTRNRELSPRNARRSRYLLQGLLGCMECEAAFAGHVSTHRKKDGTWTLYRYYSCNGHATTDRRPCAVRAMNADDLEEQVWDAVRGVLEDPSRILNEWSRRTHADGVVQRVRASRDTAARVVAELDRADKRLLDAYEGGAIEVPELKLRRDHLRARRRTADVDLAEAERQLHATVDLREVITTVERFRDQVREGLDCATWEQKRDVAKSLVRCVDVGPQSIRVTFRVPGDRASPSRGPDDPEDDFLRLRTDRATSTSRRTQSVHALLRTSAHSRLG